MALTAAQQAECRVLMQGAIPASLSTRGLLVRRLSCLQRLIVVKASTVTKLARSRSHSLANTDASQMRLRER